MRKYLLLLLCVVATSSLSAQNSRLVKGVIFTEDDIPLGGATIESVGMPGSGTSLESGTFELYVSPYAKKVKVSKEGFLPQTAEIDGSYLVFKLKVDKEYAKRVAAAEEAARVAAEQEAARIAAAEEAARVAAAEEAARIAAEKKAAKEEAARKAAEEKAARKAAKEEAARKAAEEKAARKAAKEEAARIAAAEEELESISEPEEPAAAYSTIFERKSSSYVSFVEGQFFNDGCENPLTLRYIGGVTLGSKLFVGAGVGYGFSLMPICPMDHELPITLVEVYCVNLPIFAHIRWSLGMWNRFEAFVAFSVGGVYYDIDKQCYNESTGTPCHITLCTTEDTTFSPFFNPQIGVSMPLSEGVDCYFSLGYNLSYVPTYDAYEQLENVHSGIDFRVGIAF
jgi:hypothetical protein